MRQPMDNTKKQQRIGSSITLANNLNISHDEVMNVIKSLNDNENFILHEIKLANGKNAEIYDVTNDGIEKVEALYRN
jgi:hypothetical protein